MPAATTSRWPSPLKSPSATLTKLPAPRQWSRFAEVPSPVVHVNRVGGVAAVIPTDGIDFHQVEMSVPVHVCECDAVRRAVAQRSRREPEVGAIAADVQQVRFGPMTAIAEHHVKAPVTIDVS